MFNQKLKLLFVLLLVTVYSVHSQAPVTPKPKTPATTAQTKPAPPLAGVPVPPVIQQAANFQYQNGDLLFQQLQCGELCDAIHKVTVGIHHTNFSHVGILTLKNGKMEVIEAIDKDVHTTPLEVFLQRSVDKKGLPLVAVGRLKTNDRQLANMAAANAEQYMGFDYNFIFDWNSHTSLYCSQLVLKAYSLNGISIFQNIVQPMTFMDNKTGKFLPAWQRYFGKYAVPIPEGKPGCNPGALSRDAQLDIFYPYSQFD
jgi:hypothetical protein